MNTLRYCKLFSPVPKQEAWEECDLKGVLGYLLLRLIWLI